LIERKKKKKRKKEKKKKNEEEEINELINVLEDFGSNIESEVI